MSQGALSSAEAVLRRAEGLPTLASATANEIDDALCDTLALAGQADAAATVGTALLERLRTEGAPAAARARVHLRLARVAVSAAQWDRADDHLAATAELSPKGGTPSSTPISPPCRPTWRSAGATTTGPTAWPKRRWRWPKPEQPAQVCEALEVLGRCLRRTDLAAAERSSSAPGRWPRRTT